MCFIIWLLLSLYLYLLVALDDITDADIVVRLDVQTANCPAIEAVSTIGAGDSTIAGFLAGAYAGEGAMGCLRTAVSYGTAACLTAGTLPPEKEDIDKIYSQIDVIEVM